MATSKDFAKSAVKSSEETFDICCSPCTEAGKTKEATHFCAECDSYFCGKCLLHHNKFPALRSHQIVDTSGQTRRQQQRPESNLPTERCVIHHGKLIDMFCGDHDEVCCAACIATKHRACVNVDYLPDIAQGVHDSTEVRETKISLKDVLPRLKREKDQRKQNLASLDQEKDQIMKDVDKYETEWIQKIKQLSKSAKIEICSKHEEYKKAIQSDVDTLDTLISTISSAEQKLSIGNRNEAQLFVNVKTSRKSVEECETLLRNMSSRHVKVELKFTPNIGLKGQLTCLGSLSADEDIKEYKATLYGKFKVSTGRCEITGACAMEDGTFVISNYTNTQLIRLNRDFTVKDKIAIGIQPYSVQRVGPKEVAVFCRNGKVQFVSTGDQLKLTTSFCADNSFSGGYFYSHNDEMFILQNEHLILCKKSGDILRKYQNKDIFQNSEPKQTALCKNNSTIYFGNDTKGLLALNRDGRTLWTFTDPMLTQAWGVCVLPGNIILVSDLSSSSIFQVDRNGKKIGTLLGPSGNIPLPFAFAFDRSTSRLVVECSSNEIHVYTLSNGN